MLLTVLFLITCVITVIVLDRHKMNVASVAYLVMLAFAVFALLFTSDIEFIRSFLQNVFGWETWYNIRLMLLEAIRSETYGIIITVAIVITFAAQITLSLMCAVKAIYYCCFHKSSLYFKTKRAYCRLVKCAKSLLRSKRIILLYCRLLN